MNRLVIWPYAIPMDLSGNALDEYQGIYSRGLCRAFAEGLLRARVCEVAVCLPIVTIGEVTSWAVTGREWNPDEAMEKPLPKDTDFMTWGTLSVTDRIELHVLLISRSQRQLLLDRQFSYPRAQILNCLSEGVAALASAIAGRPLNEEEMWQLQLWGTDNSDAYLAYLEAWSAAAAFRFGVSVPNPQAALECATKAAQLDPKFAEAEMLQAELGSMEVRSNDDEANEWIGYSEFVYPITIPGQTVASKSY